MLVLHDTARRATTGSSLVASRVWVTSFALFNPARDFAVIVLFNRSIDDGSFADDLGKHVVQRLTGAPAESLAP